MIHVVKVEKSYETEYGLPSTHALSAFLPLTALHALQQYYVPFHWSWWLAAWSNIALISMSRLYLGVHSPTDILFAIGMGVIITQTTRVYGDSLDAYFCATSGGAVTLATLMLAFNTVYPRAAPWRAAYGGAATIFGTWWGVFAGLNAGMRYLPHAIRELQRSSLVQPAQAWYLSHLFASGVESDYSVNSGGGDDLIMSKYSRELLPASVQWRRLALATAFLLAVKLLSKHGAAAVCLRLARRGLVRPRAGEERDALGQPVALAQSYGVEVSVRVVSYVCVGCGAVLGASLVWVWGQC